MWILEIWTLVLVLVCQALYPLSHPLSLLSVFLFKSQDDFASLILSPPPSQELTPQACTPGPQACISMHCRGLNPGLCTCCGARVEETYLVKGGKGLVTVCLTSLLHIQYPQMPGIAIITPVSTTSIMDSAMRASLHSNRTHTNWDQWHILIIVSVGGRGKSRNARTDLAT